MAQETDLAVEATEEVTASPDLAQPEETLAPESVEQETSAQPGQEQPTPAEPAFDLEAEQTIEFGGKNFTLKGKDLIAVLENQQALAEKEKSLNRDYTQKMQKFQGERKSIESAFGKMPAPEEFKALGKLYQSYLSDPNVAKVVDALLQGAPLESVIGNDPSQTKSNANPEVSALQREIASLKGQLSQFLTTSEQKERDAKYQEGQRLFETWREGKKSGGVNVSEEIVDHLLETAGALMRRNPSWDANKALDEAYRRETIDEVEKTTTQKVLAKADNAKKVSAIKITPKTAKKPDSEMGYSEIFRGAM